MLKFVQFMGQLTNVAPQVIKLAPQIFALFAAVMEAYHTLQPEHKDKVAAAFTKVAEAVEAHKPPA